MKTTRVYVKTITARQANFANIFVYTCSSSSPAPKHDGMVSSTKHETLVI